jgi:hypothetical protein
VAGTVGTTIGALTNNLYVLHGNGDGTFQAATTEPLVGTDGIGATSLVLADFNGDGTLDIALGNPNDFTEIILSSGNGTFVHTLMALAQQPQALAAAALPGHQFADLVVGSSGVGTAVYLNPGNAAAWTVNTTPLPTVSISLIGGPPNPITSQFILTWPTNAAGFTLQSTTNLGSSAVWTTNSLLPVVVNGQYTLTNAASGAQKFFRLSQ